jgi:hypothetical protein
MGKTQLNIAENGLLYIKYRFVKTITPEKLFEIVRGLFDEFPAVNVSQMKKFSQPVMFYKNMPDKTLMMALSDLLRIESLIATPTPRQSPESQIHIVNPLSVATQVKPQKTPTVVIESAPEPNIITEKPDGLDVAVLNKTTHMTLKPNANIKNAKQTAQKLADNGFCCVKILDSNGVWICTVYPHNDKKRLADIRNLAHQVLNNYQH